jgi:hypothetical protein
VFIFNCVCSRIVRAAYYYFLSTEDESGIEHYRRLSAQYETEKMYKEMKDLKAKMSYQMFTIQGQWTMDEFPMTCFNYQSNTLF